MLYDRDLTQVILMTLALALVLGCGVHGACGVKVDLVEPKTALLPLIDRVHQLLLASATAAAHSITAGPPPDPPDPPGSHAATSVGARDLKQTLAAMERALGSAPVFLTAAEQHDGVETVRDFLAEAAQIHPWLYPATMVRGCGNAKTLPPLPPLLRVIILTRRCNPGWDYHC